MRTPDDVLAYYADFDEDGRLGTFRLELERTKELLLRHLPPGGRVADVGGGTGRYAEWLVSLGYEVELVDPAPNHLARARARGGFGVHRADARKLPFPDRSFDSVLLLGPLYHLGERADRVAAVREAARVARPAAVVAAAAISRLAPLLNVLVRREMMERPDDALENMLEEVAIGRRVPPERRRGVFPDAWFHRPEELAGELGDGGVRVDAVYGVEGPGWLAEGTEDPAILARVLRVARFAEQDEALRPLSPHLLAVGKTA
ncbi:MAG TPA: class I SAM-dependent methyltransferase [Gaiellaceae bacterium]